MPIHGGPVLPPSGAARCTNGYDPNGNLLAKTDARGVTTSYTYDALNRVIHKSYNDGITLATDYDYDQHGDWDGLPIGNQVGRLAHTDVGQGTPSWDEQLYSYDPMGRMILMEEATPSEVGTTNHVTTAKYDVAGNLTDLWYPRLVGTAGPHLQQGWGPAGRLAKVYTTDTSPETDYWTANSYFPDGTTRSVAYGNGVNEQRVENSRLQTCELSAFLSPPVGGTMVMDHQYFFSAAPAVAPCQPTPGNNGNIAQIVDNTNPTAGSNLRNQTFGYDGLNRLTSWSTPLMSGSPRSQSFTYDSFGNMAQIAGVNMPNFPVGYGGPNTPWPYDSTNHLQGTYFNCAAAAPTGPNPGYDLAGNVLCQGVNGIDAQSYLYDAESRVTQVLSQSMGNTYAASATYTYDAGGTRVRKDLAPFNNQAFTEYSYFDGQPISEKDQTGNWTDYIYAGGQKIAKSVSAETVVTISGSSANGPSDYEYFPTTALRGYTVQAGDALHVRQRNHGVAFGGIEFDTDMAGTSQWTLTGTAQDLQGELINEDTTADGQWHERTIDLSSMVGNHVMTVYVSSYASVPGAWSADFTDFVVTSADGSVHPIFTGTQAIGLNAWGSPGMSAVVYTISPVSTDAAATRYYIGDHLGTTQMEFAAGGWPLWQGNFAPFGQEVLPGVAMDFVGPMPGDGTAMHYKFTGKERDAESGLDYFGARYLSSNMGRWMSPDWSAKEEPVPYAKLDDPQSLNLYGYVGNNPLSRADKDGHCWPWCTALAGAALGAFAETAHEAYNGEGFDSSKIEAAALGGIVIGIVGPLGGVAGMGVVGTVGYAALGSVLGGATEKIAASALSGSDSPPYPVTIKEIIVNGTLGAAGVLTDGIAAKVASGAAKTILSNGAQTATDVAHRNHDEPKAPAAAPSKQQSPTPASPAPTKKKDLPSQSGAPDPTKKPAWK